MPNQFITAKVKEFEEKYKAHVCSGEGCLCIEGIVNYEDAGDFLTSALLQYQAKIREMVEGKEPPIFGEGKATLHYNYGYKTALSDLLSNELLNNK